jgi:Transcription elongation factor, GreA/GreB, C-term
VASQRDTPKRLRHAEIDDVHAPPPSGKIRVRELWDKSSAPTIISYVTLAVVSPKGDGQLLPNRPVSPHPNLVTAAGLQALERQLQQAQEAYEAAQKIEDMNDRRRQGVPFLCATRGISRREFGPHRSFLILHRSMPFLSEAVTFSRADGRGQKYRIVGEEEADPKAGTISYVSPVARALMGNSLGDVVETSAQ